MVVLSAVNSSIFLIRHIARRWQRSDEKLTAPPFAQVFARPHWSQIGEVPQRRQFIFRSGRCQWHDVIDMNLSAELVPPHSRQELLLDVCPEFLKCTPQKLASTRPLPIASVTMRNSRPHVGDQAHKRVSSPTLDNATNRCGPPAIPVGISCPALDYWAFRVPLPPCSGCTFLRLWRVDC